MDATRSSWYGVFRGLKSAVQRPKDLSRVRRQGVPGGISCVSGGRSLD
jgi:hypothetical protein